MTTTLSAIVTEAVTAAYVRELTRPAPRPATGSVTKR
jgi:hypothetical protein